MLFSIQFVTARDCEYHYINNEHHALGYLQTMWKQRAMNINMCESIITIRKSAIVCNIQSVPTVKSCACGTHADSTADNLDYYNMGWR